MFSSHLLLMAVLIVAPDAKRLARFFIYNQPVAATPYYPLMDKPWQKVVRVCLKLVFIVAISAADVYALFQGSEPKPPMYGIYDVKTFVSDNDTLAPLITDTVRWRRLVISSEERASVFSMNDKRSRYTLSLDTAKRIIKLSPQDKEWYYLKYRPINDSTLLASGNWQGKYLRMELHKRNLNDMLLISRGFHWVNAKPFNR